MRILKLLITSSVLCLPTYGAAQLPNQTKILGSWTCEKIEFLTSMEDSANFLKNIKSSTVLFEPMNTVTVTFRRDSAEKLISGTYLLNADGSTLTQNGIDSKIIKLTESELVLRVEDGSIFIAYFKKQASQH